MAWREDIETSQPRSRPPMSASPAAPFPPYFDEPSSPPSHRKASLGQSSYAYDNGETRWGGSESTKKAKAPFPRAFIDTFRRAPMSRYTEPEFALEDDAEWDQIHHQLKASHYTTNTGLARKLKGRHLQMIAIGGSIGTGLFVASGSALAKGGPASLLIAFTLIGLSMYCTVQALGEMAVLFPVAGSFSAYSTRFLDPAWGFAMGWNYAMQWLVVLPLEIIAASTTLSYWDFEYNQALFVTIFLFMIVFINCFGVKGYGEAEFCFSLLKVVAVIGFIILGIIINCAGTQTSGYVGGKYWHDPGPFHGGFKGLCSVFVTAAFAFAGTELVGLAAAETENPRKSLPSAIKQVFWRITLFYIVSLLLVGLLVSHTDERLLGNGPGASASPFVIAITDAGIEVLPSVMNVVVLIAVLSVGNSSVFGSSRTLAALADQGQAPKILGYVDRKGRPIISIAVASAMGLLGYCAGFDFADDVLNWMLALSGLSSIFTWGSICLAHIRFRSAWAIQGFSVSDLPYKSQAGIWGSWIGFIFNMLVLVAQFWTGIWPLDYAEMTVREQVENFFLGYLAAPIVLIMWGGYKLVYRTRMWDIRQMDVSSGRREQDNFQAVQDMEKEQRMRWPKWKRWYYVVC